MVERPSQTFGPVADLMRGISVGDAMLCGVCDGRGVYESADIKTGQRIEFECYECAGRGWLRSDNG